MDGWVGMASLPASAGTRPAAPRAASIARRACDRSGCHDQASAQRAPAARRSCHVTSCGSPRSSRATLRRRRHGRTVLASLVRSSPRWRRAAPGRPPRRASRRRQAPGPAGTSFWEHILARKERCRTLQNLVLHLERAVGPAQPHQLRSLLGRQALALTLVDLCLPQPAMQRRRRDTKFGCDPADRLRSQPGPTPPPADGTPLGRLGASGTPLWATKSPQASVIRESGVGSETFRY